MQGRLASGMQDTGARGGQLGLGSVFGLGSGSVLGLVLGSESGMGLGLGLYRNQSPVCPLPMPPFALPGISIVSGFGWEPENCGLWSQSALSWKDQNWSWGRG